MIELGLPCEKKKFSPPDKKRCIACGKEKKVGDFYKNRDNHKNNGYDYWCKKCAAAFVKNKETMKQYCEQNSRVFSSELWDKGYELALSDVNSGKVAEIDGDVAKDAYATKKAVSYYFMQMSLNRWYEYKEVQEPLPRVQIKSNGDDSSSFSVDEVCYSEFWEGNYTSVELEKLNKKYAEYEADFDVPDVHTRDMYKKIVKMSYMQDEAIKEVEREPSKEKIDYLDKITKMVNTLSDSTKLSLSKRTSNDKGGFTDLGSLIARVENTGALCRKQEFEKDDVDYAISEYIRGATASLINENIDVLVDNIEQNEGEDFGS